MNVIKALENRIGELQNWEWEAKEVKDYPACLRLYGAILYFKQFLAELKEGRSTDELSNGNG
jgi:hypothetical protein